MVGGPWYLPGSAVNELRRQGLEKLLEKRSALRPVESHQPQLAPPPRRAVPERQQLTGCSHNRQAAADRQVLYAMLSHLYTSDR